MIKISFTETEIKSITVVVIGIMCAAALFLGGCGAADAEASEAHDTGSAQTGNSGSSESVGGIRENIRQGGSSQSNSDDQNSAAESAEEMTYTEDSRISDVINDPVFGGHGRLLFPADSGYWSGDTLGNLNLVWYNDIDPDTTVDIVNTLHNRAAAGETVFYDIYSDEEKAADPDKEDTGLFFFRGNKGAKTAIVNAGGGFVYVGAMQDSFPVSLELSRQGYNAFALIYRPGAETACEDLSRAVAFLTDHADELGIDMTDYSLWGGSAGARMAAWVGTYGTAEFGEKEYPKPAAVIMQYTGLSEVTGDEPPTYACVGTSDGIASWRTMQNRINEIKANGTSAEIDVFDGLPHGFGLGIGTVAEGWTDHAVQFWRENMSTPDTTASPGAGSDSTDLDRTGSDDNASGGNASENIKGMDVLRDGTSADTLATPDDFPKAYDYGDGTLGDWSRELMLKKMPEPESPSDTVLNADIDPSAFQAFYLWEEGNVPAETEFTSNMTGYFDDYDFRPYVTAIPVREGVKPKGAVVLMAGGAYQFRGNYTDSLPTAAELRELGFRTFIVDYRLSPYTQQEGALDVARAVRFIRKNADVYGIDPDDIAVMGYSAGGIQAGQFLMGFDEDVNGTVLDPDYKPDSLDEVPAHASADGMIYSFYGRLSHGTLDEDALREADLPPTFYVYGTEDPFYSQFEAQYSLLKDMGIASGRIVLDGWPHGFGGDGGWVKDYAAWLESVFQN